MVLELHVLEAQRGRLLLTRVHRRLLLGDGLLQLLHLVRVSVRVSVSVRVRVRVRVRVGLRVRVRVW